MKILLAFRDFAYGGPPTHLITLAKYLKEQGITVVVTSKGGKLVPKLQEVGVEHYQVNFQPKGWRSWQRQVSRLHRLLETEAFDLVHEHSFSVAPFFYLVNKSFNLPRIMTMHSKEHYWFRYAAFYLPRNLIFISKELENYWLHRLKIKTNQSITIENSIDLGVFRPVAPEKELLHLYKVGEEDLVIVHLSRFSHSKGRVALALIEAVKGLCPQFPGIRLIVAGEGRLFRRITDLANEVNQGFTKEIVTVSDPILQPERLYNLADLVVGTGRVALEAMACARPLLAVGKFGQVGMVHEQNLRLAIDHNFGDNNGPWTPITVRNLTTEIAGFIDEQAYYQAQAKMIRQTIANKCSMEALGEKTLEFYRTVLAGPE